MFFGFIYVGSFQYFLYNYLYPIIFPGTNIKSIIIKVAFNQFIKHPIIYFPVFYSTKEAINQKQFNLDIIQTALQKYRNNMVYDCLALWSIGIPINAIVFGITPMHYRVPVTAFGSFLWTSIMSFYRGKYASQ